MSDADALRNTHGRLPAVLRSRSSILITLDQNGVVLLWNSGAEKAFGLSEAEVMGTPFTSCGIRWDWGRIRAVAPAGVSAVGRRLVQSYTRRDGSIGALALQVLPQFGPDGTLAGCLWLGTDTSEPEHQLTTGPVYSQGHWRPPGAPPREGPGTGMRTPPPGTLTAQPGVGMKTPPPVRPDQAASSRTFAPVAADSAATRSFDPVPLSTLDASAGEPGGERGKPVEADPTKHFPVHLSFLDGHLVAQGDDLSRWRIVQATETRLDESGMEVVFTLTQRYPGQATITRRILVHAGELIRISDA